MAFANITQLLESVPDYKETWIECLGDLARYRMAIEEVDMYNRRRYTSIARYWYAKAANLNPDVGRIQHHLAVLARPDLLKQLFYYSKALIGVQPFTKARDSILLLFRPLLDPAKAAIKYPEYYSRTLTVFVEAHGVLFTRKDAPTFLRLAEEFLSELDKHAGLVAAIFDYGHDGAEIPSMFDQASGRVESRVRDRDEGGSIQTRTLEIMEQAYESWQNPSCVQVGIEHRTAGISSSKQVVSMASHLSFATLDVILGGLKDIENTLPSVHVSLAFLWCMAMVLEAMSRIQADVPWKRLATYLNKLIKTDTDMVGIENGEFPARESGLRQLPEDFLIHGLSWSRIYYPPGFFSDMAEGDERSIEPPSVTVARTKRCLWLASKIAKFNCWLLYDVETHGFYATQFADELTALSQRYQIIGRTDSIITSSI
ncbi:conserved hypothetical protein [Talaromyces stipitatus ATCC 10500]|uniref:DNA/RNA-binding domain-containing protein n=1 Tax=Talaromyces stipitatus (strain ATCC 10500 / CBS 375.48 / QM 6759 / NRRL 1006) TaxID=441959 RepID=B8MUP4_TALSN|nr:uncharacterized protein TSTA_108930 [Talaromyces stipitatus ATCC 10500]EED11712.1 conserved hypothetical protein [Talaromyces stipitatus ATCC 10500]